MKAMTLVLRLCAIAVIPAFAGIEAMAADVRDVTLPANGSIVRVALFADAECTDGKSTEAIFKLLSERDDMLIDMVSSETVRTEGFMKSYDVLILPGGTGSGQANAIGLEAGRRLAGDVKGGKGIVAICAGGYYLANGGSKAGQALDIINTRNHDGEHWARGEGMISVEVLERTDPQSSRTMWYENGPLLKPADSPELPSYTPLVKYVTDMAAPGAPTGQMSGRDAVIAAPYGNGRVVLFGPHPELSPGLHHWLTNSVKWAAGKTGGNNGEISVKAVLGD